MQIPECNRCILVSVPQLRNRQLLPKHEQALACLRVCQMLSNYYRNIELFRFNEQKGYVYIWAGEELQILVFQDGNWRFIDETEL